MERQSSDTFYTRDPNLAAYLVATGGPFPEVRAEPGSLCEFLFVDPEGQLSWQAEEYRVRPESAMVCAPHLATAMKHLKRAMAEAKKIAH